MLDLARLENVDWPAQIVVNSTSEPLNHLYVYSVRSDIGARPPYQLQIALRIIWIDHFLLLMCIKLLICCDVVVCAV